ncbi:MAG: response regulator [Hydrococcus sp. C42_A2020_068]|uniref:response regulator n=1 Tax=Pleurocapsa sp. PCC 7327 TaxID=118163 RepID=UPI00029FEC2A|nr:response regulator [Pleurocapsa sp. PCC 7327]AFY77221.1 response regulator with CheY-like receiver, AAA-type ATPase, and DNA-binding domains [Pleurocapsa sp. PCC 7327]MBF2022662.1 response regulator [Hydrococcus sp. C42_A2020_068]
MRILIIDDEDDIREATQICLEVTGDWEVLTASSGREGLAKAAAEQPDAILLDVMMPDMDGLATLEKLQASPATNGIPVILLTAKAQPAEQRRFSQLDVAAVILKPYDPFTLSDQVIDALKTG